jgi:hypothetical protein
MLLIAICDYNEVCDNILEIRHLYFDKAEMCMALMAIMKLSRKLWKNLLERALEVSYGQMSFCDRLEVFRRWFF